MSDSDDALPLRVVLCWHMHQPQYRDLIDDSYYLPWTYLHALKDYVDMAAHLEAVPGARAVINFAPVLLEQIDDYAQQVEAWLNKGKSLRDPLLAALVAPKLPTEPVRRMRLLNDCLRINRKIVQRFEAFAGLLDLAAHFQRHGEELVYASDQFLIDLLFWYHLGWLGETVRRENAQVQQWQEQGGNFTTQQRRELMSLIGDLLGGLIERYARLAEEGRAELSMTPYAHPIIPLMLDVDSAREAMPEVALPQIQSYPGGKKRARWHLREGLKVFRSYFGFSPRGCWPSEGGVSQAQLALLESQGFEWAASGETVLRNSLRASLGEEAVARHDAVFKGYRFGRGKLVSFFRDDGLSDGIGFNFSDWHADDAVANLVHSLEQIRAVNAGRKLVVPIILDGENAWEHYPDNAYHFLAALYRRLDEHPQLQLSTFAECLDAGVERETLPSMVSGSWVYGTFSTWIGDPDKNRGWEMLAEAKQAFDRVAAEGTLSKRKLARARRQLACCEGSDWFWWFGDYNPADSVSDFESLFRRHLSNLYSMLGVEAPSYLSQAFAHGSGDPALGGVMRKGYA